MAIKINDGVNFFLRNCKFTVPWLVIKIQNQLLLVVVLVSMLFISVIVSLIGKSYRGIIFGLWRVNSDTESTNPNSLTRSPIFCTPTLCILRVPTDRKPDEDLMKSCKTFHFIKRNHWKNEFNSSPQPA